MTLIQNLGFFHNSDMIKQLEGIRFRCQRREAELSTDAL